MQTKTVMPISLEVILLLLFSRKVSHATTLDDHQNHCSNGRILWTQRSPNVGHTTQRASNAHDSVRNASRQLKRAPLRLMRSKRPRHNTCREVTCVRSDSHMMSSNVAGERAHHSCMEILPLPNEPNTMVSGCATSLVLQQVRGVSLPEQRRLQLRPSLLTSPMFAQCVSRVDSS